VEATNNLLCYNNIVGITHVKGDMFESVPKGDAIFLKVNRIHAFS